MLNLITFYTLWALSYVFIKEILRQSSKDFHIFCLFKHSHCNCRNWYFMFILKILMHSTYNYCKRLHKVQFRFDFHHLLKTGMCVPYFSQRMQIQSNSWSIYLFKFVQNFSCMESTWILKCKCIIVHLGIHKQSDNPVVGSHAIRLLIQKSNPC